MRKSFYLVLVAVLALLTACKPNPQQLAGEAIQEFVREATAGNKVRMYELYPSAHYLYQNESATNPENGTEDEPEYNLVVPTKVSFSGNPDITILDVTLSTLGERVSTRTFPWALSRENEPTYDFPKVCYVESVYQGKRLYWVVGFNENMKPTILGTEGLYDPDLTAFERTFGCTVELVDNEYSNVRSDESRYNRMNSIVEDLKAYKHFEWRMNHGDLEGACTYFPNLRENVDKIKNPQPTISINRYRQSENSLNKILSGGPVSFIIDSNRRITDCKGLLDYTEAQQAVVAEGGEYESPRGKWDISYINGLKRQTQQLHTARLERERAAHLRAQGVGLTNHHFVRGEKNGQPTKGVEFTIANFSDKEIKYVRLEIVGYNSVDDPVWDGGYVQRVRGIGPMRANSTASWTFDDIWTQNPSIVSSYEIKSMTIDFKNGSSKTFRNPELLPSNWRSMIY